MKRIVSGLLIILSLHLAFGAEEFREWTDQQGRKIQARLTGYDAVNGLVTFEHKNHNVTLPLSILSPESSELVRNSRFATPNHPVVIDTLINENVAAEKKEILSNAQILLVCYTRILNRQPTAEESRTIPLDIHPVIDSMVDSDEFSERLYQFVGGILEAGNAPPEEAAYPDCKHVQKERLPVENPAPERYRQWLREQVRNDRPWDELATALLLAKGDYTQNPEIGFLLETQTATALNPSLVMTAFTGTEISCARCHNHPHEAVEQLDFFRIAAFFGQARFERNDHDISLFDGDNRTRLPASYKYANGQPNQLLSPATWFGGEAKAMDFATNRGAFAAWLTDDKNPRFTINIVNRLWKFAFGTALVEPPCNLPGILETKTKNLKLLFYLENLMRQERYHMRAFLKHLYKTEAFFNSAP